MRYIAITEVDQMTRKLCTKAPMAHGPYLPVIQSFEPLWSNESEWPVACTKKGVYKKAPLHFGTVDDDVDIKVPGVVGEYTEQEFERLKRDEYFNRRIRLK